MNLLAEQQYRRNERPSTQNKNEADDYYCWCSQPPLALKYHGLGILVAA